MTDSKTATERLRELLDERGVEWRAGSANEYRVETFFDDANGHPALFVDYGNGNPFGGGSELSADVTPEQAIAATLGSRECERNSTISWTYSGTIKYYEHELSCGHVVTDEEQEPPAFCPNCGAKIRKAVER